MDVGQGLKSWKWFVGWWVSSLISTLRSFYFTKIPVGSLNHFHSWRVSPPARTTWNLNCCHWLLFQWLYICTKLSDDAPERHDVSTVLIAIFHLLLGKSYRYSTWHGFNIQVEISIIHNCVEYRQNCKISHKILPRSSNSTTMTMKMLVFTISSRWYHRLEIISTTV